MATTKIDLKKIVSSYKAGKKPAFMNVPTMKYLQIDGKGNPNTSRDFEQAIEALYSVAYTLKFMVKKGPTAVDYGVGPLEGLWWAKDMNDFLQGNKDNWYWTLMIMQPELVTEAMYEEAKESAAKRKDLPALSKMRFQKFAEGMCAQVLYTGPYSGEHDTILGLHGFIEGNGYKLHGYHHEIYLNDARRTAPEKLKTVIRQPAFKSGN